MMRGCPSNLLVRYQWEDIKKVRTEYHLHKQVLVEFHVISNTPINYFHKNTKNLKKVTRTEFFQMRDKAEIESDW